MTHSDLHLFLYSDFNVMHAVWRAMSSKHGVGAFVFLPEDYQDAAGIEEVQYRYWRAEDVTSYLKESQADNELDFAGDLDFMRYINLDGFLALVVSDGRTTDRPGVHVLKVTRLSLN